MAATTLWGSDKIAGITVDPDGAIWLGAYSRLGLGGEEDSGFTASLVRFNDNGSLDRTFSGDGKSLLPVAFDIEDGGNGAVQPGGGYLVTRYVQVGDAWVSGISRNLADGSLDTSFGNGGTVTVPFYWNEDLGQQASFSVQRDGSFFASAGYPLGRSILPASTRRGPWSRLLERLGSCTCQRLSAFTPAARLTFRFRPTGGYWSRGKAPDPPQPGRYAG